jgi:drug/metabolite transporter (DMT)-like permease
MPSLKLWVCVGLGLGGLAIFSLTPDLKINYGDGLVFICSILFALHIIFTSQYTLQFNPLYLLGIQYILQCLLSLIAKLFWDTNPWIYPNHGQIGSFIYLAIFSTGIAFFLQAWFQRYTDTTRAALIYIMEPVFAAILGYLLLGEILSGKQWLGASIMFIALILSEMKFGKQEI